MFNFSLLNLNYFIRMSDDEDFEEQIRLEKEEKKKREALDHGKNKGR